MTALAFVAAGCGAVGSGTPLTATPGSASLIAFGSCSQLLSQVQAQAQEVVGPYGLPYAGSGAVRGSVRHAVPSAGTFAGSASASPTTPAAGTAGSTVQSDSPAFSSTNNQEQGVDEADLVKTDGNVLVALRQNPVGIQVAKVGSSARLGGFLALGELGNPSGLFLIGNKAVVLLNGVPVGPQASSGGSTPSVVGPAELPAPTTEVAVISLADPDHPVMARSFSLQGSEVDARLVGGYLEVVVVSAPQLPFVAPTVPSGTASQQALAENRAIIASSTAAQWLPSVTSLPSGITRTSDCGTVMHPTAASGLDTVSVVPIDPNSDQPRPAVTVVGDASTVYASTTSLYVATSPWSPVGPVAEPAGASGDPSGRSDVTTAIHGFDLSDPATPRYLGSGQVPGTLIGQYALSEYQGYLRVATTVGSPTPPPSEGAIPATLSDNRVTVLQPQGGTLVPVGSVGGLGGGEKIYAVRFMGALGYVVTFRQTDPLYVLDLSDPQHPVASGQLELTGYSSFLEPLANNRLLGVGQDVDPNLRRDGLQISLFDVSDPQHPALISKVVLADASSTAEDDPHALLYWPPANLAVLPVEQMEAMAPSSSAVTSPFNGAVAFRIDASSLTEAGRVSQPPVTSTEPPSVGTGVSGGPMLPASVSVPTGWYPSGPGVERALVVGSMLYTVSDTGILVSDLGTFAEAAWLPYS